MNKDYKSYIEEWLIHENAWNSFSAKEITTEFASSYDLAEQASNVIASSGLEGISSIHVSATKWHISQLETEREKLCTFCKKIHSDAEDLIDDVFTYGVLKTLADIYALDPSDITCTSMGTEYQLNTIIETVIFDPILKAEFDKKSRKLDNDGMTNNLKKGIIEAIGRYYDGDVTPYMRKAAGYDINNFNEDMNLVIEYYEYLNPADGKDMNHFLTGLAKDGDKKYLEDIRNIKFITYTAMEPYRSVFFKYLKKLKISDYDYHEKDDKGKEMAQHYSGDSKSLYIRFYETDGKGNNIEGKNDPRGAYVTFFHEIGHGIDDLTLKDDKFLLWTSNVNYTTSDASGLTVFEAAEGDVKANISNSIHNYVEKNYKSISSQIDENKILKAIMTYGSTGLFLNSKEKSVYNGVIKNYQRNFSKNTTNATKYCGISDVYGGYTSNKLRGTYGHDNSVNDGTTYWNNLKNNNKYTGKQGKELWAEAFSRYMTSNEESIEQMEKYFPTSMKIMKKKLNHS